MSYYFSKTLDTSFDAAVEHTTAVLKDAGFGIITEIDVKETFRKKLGIDYRNYRILGACNPKMAFEALSIEDKVGTMLPCNVIVQDLGGGKVEVAAIVLWPRWLRSRTRRCAARRNRCAPCCGA
jgi:uncharacterized protein (DUF302 family)